MAFSGYAPPQKPVLRKHWVLKNAPPGRFLAVGSCRRRAARNPKRMEA